MSFTLGVMPVETKRDEEKWQKAKSIAAEAGREGDYAYIMGIYKHMKPDYEFKSEGGKPKTASAARVVARFRQATSDAAQEAVDKWLKESKITDLIRGMSAEAKKDGERFGMRDARAVLKAWFEGGAAPTEPKLAAGYRYLKTPKGEKAIMAIVKGVGAALKGAGGRRGLRDVAKAVDTWMGY